MGNGYSYFIDNLDNLNKIIISVLEKTQSQNKIECEIEKINDNIIQDNKNKYIKLNDYFRHGVILDNNNKDEIKFKIKYDKKEIEISMNNIEIKNIPKGEELGKLIIDNYLINNKSLDFRTKIKLSKDYNILCSETAFYAEIQNEVPIKEKMTTIINKDKTAINNNNDNKIINEELEAESELRNMGYENKNYNINNNEMEENNEENNKKGILSWLSSIFFCKKEKNKIINKKSFEYHEKKEWNFFPKFNLFAKDKVCCCKCCDCCCCMESPLRDISLNKVMNNNKISSFSYEKENCYDCDINDNKEDKESNECNNICNEMKNSSEKFIVQEECISPKEINNKILNFDDIILGQDIIEGNWKRDNNNEILIEQEKDLYEKIKKYSEGKGINDENGIITLFILYYIFKKKNERVEELKFVIDKAKKYIKKIFNLEYDEIEKELDIN